MNSDSARNARLRKVFNAFIHGNRKVSTRRDAEIFLEALTSHPSSSACLEITLASPVGLPTLHDGVRASSDPSFLRGHVLPLLSYLSQPEAKAICESQLLQKTIAAILEPPTAWRALLLLYTVGGMSHEQAEAFAWLCHEIVTHPKQDLALIVKEIETTLKKHPLTAHTNPKVTEFGYRIQKVLHIKFSPDGSADQNGVDGPGGRHDNDFADFRDISIYPTRNELVSTLTPFYCRASEIANADPNSRAGKHLDNQFRLLREDMLADLRESIALATNQKNGKRQSVILGKLRSEGIDTGDERRGRHCALLVSVGSGLEQLGKVQPKSRKAYLQNNRNILRHQSFGALCQDGKILGFAFINRDVDNLAKSPPIISLGFRSTDDMKRAISAFFCGLDMKFVVIDAPVFAYEPVLKRLQDITEIPLDEYLLRLREPVRAGTPALAEHFNGFIQKSRDLDAEGQALRIGKKVYRLDEAQLAALARAVEDPVALIQGPPGTGKSLVGAIAAKLLLEDASARVLVLSYTNHALDQFLEDLLDIGIDGSQMTRLGSKSTPATAALSFETQSRERKIPWAAEHRTLSFRLKNDQKDLRERLEGSFQEVCHWPSSKEVLDYLEFREGDASQLYWRAFQIPDVEDDYERVGKSGAAVRPDYLINEWMQGRKPDTSSGLIHESCRPVWDIPHSDRNAKRDEWVHALKQEQMESLQEDIGRFNDLQDQIDALFNESSCAITKTKRIIGCTTTAAAKYSSLIKAAEPDYVLVEEAGEILEAHILAALGPSIKGMILIGDHKQLRPKCNNYSLSVEKGSGYDLNRSLFERLILYGHPHTTLRKQHRMHPDISQLVRSMTYPDLEDGDRTKDRSRIRGVRDRVTFINHGHPEGAVIQVGDRQDAAQKTSKENKFEADMILRTVKYLGQQGYKTENIVILTPYLGQLRLLRDMLSRDNDPLLSDLDSHELIRAGILTEAASKVGRGRIRLSTIDNYQGEESDIVVASLTRSNSKGEIGFMKSPERLNVLLSRARDGIIMFGNMETFLASPQGQDCWVPFFSLMREKNYLHDGLQVYCLQHPERTAILSTPQAFDLKCPDGGCSEPCRATLECGVHTCQRRCHRIADHNSTPCEETVQKECEKQHKFKVKCNDIHGRCSKCVQEEADIRRRAERDLELERKRMAKEEKYRRELLTIKDEMEHFRLQDKIEREGEEQANTLEQHRADLAALRERRRAKESFKKDRAAQKATSEASASLNKSESHKATGTAEVGSANYEWERMKRDELANSQDLDESMGMIGLESVKNLFLEIKGRVDTAARQGVSTKGDRFGCSLLGNPGTGKTTVARIYAKFLTGMGVIAGSQFEEVTGSKLANMGVRGCQKLLDDMLDNGGGVIFIDEAYQLSSGNNPGGAAILDYLLTEVENLRSKICFVLAGYSKQMESFFAHNPGIPSRFPLAMKFEDYTDSELLQILDLKINAKYEGRMSAEDGFRGLYCRVITRRLGRGRDKEGFGNARAVENLLGTIYGRQSKRLQRERRQGLKPDDFLLVKNDLLGPEPENALRNSAAWVRLQKLVGLRSVKESIESLVSSVKENYKRELEEKPIIEYSLNRVFLGNPGTGKTTVAKLYGQVLADIGLLSNGEVVVKNPSDFVGSVLGESEKYTNAILTATVGKVLVIDEAYGLYGGNGSQGSGGFSDPQRTAAVDTIVANVHSTVGDDRCLLLLGYRDQMEEMFQNVNPGFSRRFPLSSAFTFEDFSESELERILEMKLTEQGFTVTDAAKQVVLDMLDRARNRPNFGNAGEVDILLNEAKSRHQKRLTSGETRQVCALEPADFDENHDRQQRAEANVVELFQGTVGCEHLVSLLQGYQETARKAKQLGLNPKGLIPFNFLFRGPPGTGKSTTARKMGQVFYNAGFLASTTVHDCSASDLVGQYVGQTGPKVRQQLDKALGSVLLIDEAYRLSEGHFAKEALDELVDAITKERYHKRLIIILAGYERDINKLLTVNPGLTSRFPEVVDFRALTPSECFDLLGKNMSKQRATVVQNGTGRMNVACLEQASADFQKAVCGLFEQLSKQSSWGSARDVGTLSTAMFQSALMASSQLGNPSIVISEAIVMSEMQKMVQERETRSAQALEHQKQSIQSTLEQLLPTRSQDPPPKVSMNLAHSVKVAQPDQGEDIKDPAAEDPLPFTSNSVDDGASSPRVAVRDAGVSDEVWEQLQKDAQAEQEREEVYQAKLRAKRDAMDDALRETILKELIEEEEQRARAAAMKAKLEKDGLCPAGYSWIRQAAGWRCGGGSHFVSERELLG
ncbi:hypothetical protein LLEC1_01897 [Akanthomyces lecanii]|uniref:Helicase ATP-binding domain-containing protein n=1 Tax=Cordyceps confragosa TaxID=2714763 RepID=A0A179I750_CORDF|nr:hypothetical protein LLEC1_01897 [Akanthomyces lecanii]